MKKCIFIGLVFIVIISIVIFLKLKTDNSGITEINNETENIAEYDNCPSTEIISEETSLQLMTTENENLEETTINDNSTFFINPVETGRNSKSFNIECRTYKDYVEGKQNINIKYPQIENIPERHLKKRINSKLYEKAFSFINKYDNIENLSYSLVYTITTFDNSILSVYFEHSIYYHDSMYHFSTCDSLNIDLNTGGIINIYELIDKEQLLNLAKSNAFVPVKAVSGFEEAFSYKNLINEFLSYENIENNFYIDNKKIALFIYLSHEDGDFAIIETKNNVII